MKSFGSQKPRRPATGGLGGLIVLNAVLLGLLAVVTFAPSADAQPRIRGKYSMVAGGVIGGVSSAVYIVDTVNEELIAVHYQYSTKRLKGIGYRNISADAADLTRRGISP